MGRRGEAAEVGAGGGGGDSGEAAEVGAGGGGGGRGEGDEGAAIHGAGGGGGGVGGGVGRKALGRRREVETRDVEREVRVTTSTPVPQPRAVREVEWEVDVT